MVDHFDAPPSAHPVRRRILAAAAAGLGVALLPARARAQDWPSRPVRIVAAQAPGSSNDVSARAFADYASRSIPGTFVVENRSGAGGMIAAQAVAGARPDGYTLLVVLNSSLAQAPAMLSTPPIDVWRDLQPIASYAIGAAPMCVHKDVPARSLKELIDLAKTRSVNVGNFAIASGWQLMITQLSKDTGAQFNIVTYKGTGQMVQDLMSGVLDVAAGSLVGMFPGIQSGTFRPIALISGGPSSHLPGVPSLAQEGFTGPAYEDLVESNLLLGPAGMPQDIVARLAAAARASVTESDPVISMFSLLGVDRDHVLTGDELDAFVKRSWPAYQSLIRDLGIATN